MIILLKVLKPQSRVPCPLIISVALSPKVSARLEGIQYVGKPVHTMTKQTLAVRKILYI